MKTETFVLDNGRSISSLTPNSPGEETSIQSFVRAIPLILKEHDGRIASEYLEKAIKKNFGSSFGPADCECIRKNCPKWKNNVAWAKVQLQKEGIIACREGMVVLIHEDGAMGRTIIWALGAEKKKMVDVRGRLQPNRKAHKFAILKRKV